MDAVATLRDRVICGADSVSNPSSSDIPGTYGNINDTWDLDAFLAQCQVQFVKKSERTLELDLIGVDASIANAFRRIMLAEIPTMAIETVYFYNNTSIMHDEVLAHRLGLIPLDVDPSLFHFKHGAEDQITDLNTLVFHLKIKCSLKNEKATLEAEKYENSNVFSKHLEWDPKVDQATNLPKKVQAVDPDILIMKLRPGQEIAAELHCEKGRGADHAKWSPVATASYRLLPDIILLQPILGEDAIKFQSCFPKGVVGLRKTKKGVDEAYIIDARYDTVSRECLRHDEFKDKVLLTRKRNHFIYKVESVGAIPPEHIFLQSVKYMLGKAQLLKASLQSASSTVMPARPY